MRIFHKTKNPTACFQKAVRISARGARRKKTSYPRRCARKRSDARTRQQNRKSKRRNRSQSKSALDLRRDFHGAPLREELFEADKTKAQKTLGITNPRNKKVLLVLGGSSGARAINEAVRENLKELTNRYIVVHVTGKDKQNEKMRADDYYCVEYAHDVENYYALSDVVLSRAGATAVFEISALKKRAVFVPLPKGVSRGDQIFNADLAKEYGATILTQDDDFSSKLVPTIERAEKNPPMKRIAIDANGKIADVVCDIVGACKTKNHSQMACGRASSHGCDCVLRRAVRRPSAKNEKYRYCGRKRLPPRRNDGKSVFVFSSSKSKR